MSEDAPGDGEKRQGDHQLRRHGLDPRAVADARTCRSRPSRSPRARSARPRPAPRSSICTPATPRRAADARPGGVRRVPAADRGAVDAVINITTGGGHGMTLEERTPAARSVRAGAVLAEHGQHELRALPDARPGQRVRARLGAASISRRPATSSSATRSRTSRGSSRSSARRDAVRVRVLRRRPPLQPRPLPRARARRAAALRPDDLRDPRRHRPRPRESDAHEATADRLFGDDYYWSVLGAGRHQTPRHDGRDPGRHVRVGLEDSIYLAKGQLAESNADQVAKIAASSASSRSRSRRPTRLGRCWRSRARPATAIP